MGEDLSGRSRSDQAQVRAAPRGPGGVRGDFLPGPVQVDLADAEVQGAAPGAEGDRAHAQDPLVEVSALVQVGDGQDQVVQAGDGDRWPLPSVFLPVGGVSAGLLAPGVPGSIGEPLPCACEELPQRRAMPGGHGRVVPDHVEFVGGSQLGECADIRLWRRMRAAGEPVPEGHRSGLFEGWVHSSPVAAAVQVDQRLGAGAGERAENGALVQPQQRVRVTVRAVAGMTQPGRLQVLASSPFREQRGDADQMLIQGSAGVGQLAGSVVPQKLLDPL